MAVTPDTILGVDGGGTKTLVAVAGRDGTLHHCGRGPALDPFGDPDWPDALSAALASAAPWRARLAGAVLGLPCHGEVARLSTLQRDVAQRLVPGPHEVVNDVEAAFDGALAGRPGVLLLAGTGSMAWAGDGATMLRCGGWGDLFGDEGSAFWIGREALGEASRALDGRSNHTDFAERLLEHIGLDGERLLDWCTGLSLRRTEIAALAVPVDALAEAGEPLARDILGRAADALAAHAAACIRRLDMPPGSAWSFAGGVFRSRTVMARVTERLGAAPCPPRLPPVGGALLRAARRAGWTADDRWIERLGEALLEMERGDRAA